jgi:hypothetical protein
MYIIWNTQRFRNWKFHRVHWSCIVTRWEFLKCRVALCDLFTHRYKRRRKFTSLIFFLNHRTIHKDRHISLSFDRAENKSQCCCSLRERCSSVVTAFNEHADSNWSLRSDCFTLENNILYAWSQWYVRENTKDVPSHANTRLVEICINHDDQSLLHCPRRKWCHLPGLWSRSRSRGVGVGVGRNFRWSRNRCRGR